jgi:riboflavin kinase/FMN adenylyltransferase
LQAKQKNLKSLVVLMEKKAAKNKSTENQEGFVQLMTIPNRLKIISELGADYALVLDPKKFFQVSYEEFILDFLVRKANMREIILGADSAIGKGRQGSVDSVVALSKSTRLFDVVKTEVYGPIEKPGTRLYSSTEIRRALKRGDVEFAKRALGRRYFVDGVVVRGLQRGKKIGFPTANFAQVEVLLPTDGVYAGYAYVLPENPSGAEFETAEFEGSELEAAEFEGSELTGDKLTGDKRAGTVRYNAVASLGTNPTFDDVDGRLLEVHLLTDSDPLTSTNLNLYEKRMRFEFAEFIRPMKKFRNVHELSAQIAADKKSAEDFFR